jgi:uncharacterized protein YndB with AHSA1/START domain
MTVAKKSNEGAKYEMTMTRFLAAPRALVFKAWTDPKLVAKWFGPDGFTTSVTKWLPKKGGGIFLSMKAPDGTVYPMGGKFVKASSPDTIVFESAALDPAGKAIFEILNSVTLADEGEGTRLNIHAKVMRMRPEAKQYLKGQKEGWSQTLDRLEAVVAKLMR